MCRASRAHTARKFYLVYWWERIRARARIGEIMGELEGEGIGELAREFVGEQKCYSGLEALRKDFIA